MKMVVVVYDNRIVPNKKIQTIIGNQNYGNIVLKRETLFSKYEKIFKEENCIEEVIRIDSEEDRDNFLQRINKFKINNFIHISSNIIYTNAEEMKIIINKAGYVEENIIVKSTDNGIAIFNNATDYVDYLKNGIINSQKFEQMESDSFVNLENYNEFLKYISGGFDARFFNSMKSDDNLVIKSSKDKNKIKKEYTYYQLLPASMKKWMVMPYDYTENEDSASYTMERLFIPDLAIRWTHGAIDESELRNILDKTFYYINTRASEKATEAEAKKIADKLYVDKLLERVEKLKAHSLFPVFDAYIKNGTDYNSIDEIAQEYIEMYKKHIKVKGNLVIGHGDLCFSNMMYNNDVNLLKLIDPKGALSEEELWTDPMYDIAKLSHSICGLYDFFNCDKYSITMDKSMKFELHIKCDNRKSKEIFKEYLEKNGYDYKEIRICEVSLFLSMLPLHMDYPKKVFGFLLNAINIMKELKKEKAER